MSEFDGCKGGDDPGWLAREATARNPKQSERGGLKKIREIFKNRPPVIIESSRIRHVIEEHRAYWRRDAEGAAYDDEQIGYETIDGVLVEVLHDLLPED